tara:strand:+ start:446 stop:1039 length:594 start_codon:yes stop_codon:yes gene_type:complete
MGMDISGINPTITGDKPVFPSNWDELSEKARSFYLEIEKDWDDANPGVYFRANVWSWRPIHMAIYAVNALFKLDIDADTLDGMGYNSGHGIKDQETCNKVASCLEDMMEDMKEKNITQFGFNMGSWTARDGSFLQLTPQEEDMLDTQYSTDELITDLPVRLGTRKETKKIYPSHTTEVKHVEEFIQFLRYCGGFEVW